MFWLRMKGCFCSLGFLSFYIYKKKNYNGYLWLCFLKAYLGKLD